MSLRINFKKVFNAFREKVFGKTKTVKSGFQTSIPAPKPPKAHTYTPSYKRGMFIRYNDKRRVWGLVRVSKSLADVLVKSGTAIVMHPVLKSDC